MFVGQRTSLKKIFFKEFNGGGDNDLNCAPAAEDVRAKLQHYTLYNLFYIFVL